MAVARKQKHILWWGHRVRTGKQPPHWQLKISDFLPFLWDFWPFFPRKNGKNLGRAQENEPYLRNGNIFGLVLQKSFSPGVQNKKLTFCTKHPNFRHILPWRPLRALPINVFNTKRCIIGFLTWGYKKVAPSPKNRIWGPKTAKFGQRWAFSAIIVLLVQ